MKQIDEEKNKVLDFLNEKIDEGFKLVEHAPLSIDCNTPQLWDQRL